MCEIQAINVLEQQVILIHFSEVDCVFSGF